MSQRSLGPCTSDEEILWTLYLKYFCQNTPCLRKNRANFFLLELRQLSTNFGNFWQKDGKEAKIMQDALNFHLT